LRRKFAARATTSPAFFFEGKGPSGLAHYGHSRDHRADRPQVNLAVVTDQAGAPISLSVRRGNRADNKTLLGLLKILRRRFGIAEATFGFDGGMSGEINLQAMREVGLNYVTRLSSATRQSLIKSSPTIEDDTGQMEPGDKPRANCACCKPSASGGRNLAASAISPS
jgi:transposase